MVWEPILDDHTHILTHTQTHRQTESYNIRYYASYISLIYRLSMLEIYKKDIIVNSNFTIASRFVSSNQEDA